MRTYPHWFKLLTQDFDAGLTIRIAAAAAVALAAPQPPTIAATYYVSNSGNDAYPGMSPDSAWRTLSRINSSAVGDGDEVLFRRGDVFRGTVTNVAFTTFGAYGDGEQPVISGSVPVTGWVRHDSDIYVADHTNSAHQLFVNDKRMLLARYPNSGWLQADAGESKTTLTDAALDQPAGYWQGANVRIRTVDWVYETRPVSAYAGGQLSWDDPTEYAVKEHMGYYLDNIRNELDSAGEWYHDSARGKLYFIAPGRVDPAGLHVEAGVHAFGFNREGDWNAAGVEIRDLCIKNQSKDAVWVQGYPAHDNIFENNTFLNQGRTAISFMGEHIVIRDNTFRGITGRAIFGYQARNVIITANRLHGIGLVPGYGISGNDGMSGIVVNGTEGTPCTISDNYLDSVGYNGIAFRAESVTVERNIVRHADMTATDGGGIYCWGSGVTNCTVRDNLVSLSVGYPQINKEHSTGGAIGIYFDNEVNNCLLVNNTVHEVNGEGILLNALSHHNTVRGNTVYGCTRSQITYGGWRWMSGGAFSVYDNTVKANILYSLSPAVPTVLLLNVHGSQWDPGELDSNYYLNPYSATVIEGYDWSQTMPWTLEEWQDLTGNDMHTRTSAWTWQDTTNARTRSRLLINDTRQARTVSLEGCKTFTIDGDAVSSIALRAFEAAVVISPDDCEPSTAVVSSPGSAVHGGTSRSRERRILIDAQSCGTTPLHARVYDLSGRCVANRRTGPAGSLVDLAGRGAKMLIVETDRVGAKPRRVGTVLLQ